jgi:glutathione S-transferase
MGCPRPRASSWGCWAASRARRAFGRRPERGYSAPIAAEPRLITLAISPYNDLARWSLERAGVGYREEPKALIQHVFASRRVGGKGTTPVLIAGDEVVGESAQIAEWADDHRGAGRPPLYPEGEARDDARRLVARFGEELGPQARRLIWGHLIDDVDLASRSWGQGLSERQRRLQPWLLRSSKPLVRRAIGLRRPQVEAAPGEIRAIFDEVAERLSDGRAHLLGDELTIADISFAAMAAPAVCPPEGFPVRMPQPEDFPEPYATTIRELRAHPAGDYALKLYREERSAASPSG